MTHRIAIVTDSLSVVPRNGHELSFLRVAESLVGRYTLDLIALGPSQPDDCPAFFSSVFHIPFETSALPWGALNEMLRGRPTFMLTHPLDPASAERSPWKPYDLAWCGPVSVMGAVDWYRRQGRPLASLLALSLDDVKTTMYLDAGTELFSGRYGLDLRRLYKSLRSPFILRAERRYLRDVQLVHVPTPAEERKLRRVTVGAKRRPEVVVAPPGVKEELLALPGRSTRSRKVLFMTHIAGGRARESRWFLDRVWPLIRRRDAEAELLLVGTPPDERSGWRGPPAGARHLGWVEDLPGLLASIRVAVVPTLHSSGMVNRILDAMAAAVPVVTTKPALSTLAGAKAGRDALCGDTPEHFAEQVVSLLSDDDRYESVREHGRAFARQWLSWSDRADRILHATQNAIRQGGLDHA